MLIKSLVVGVSLVVLSAASAVAGPKEDFEEGIKAYQEGGLVASMTLLRRASDAGHAAAQAAYAYILDKSDEDEEAVKYYKMSAAQGHPDGMYGLAGMYFMGEGIKQDFVEGRKWMVKAAETGHEMATHAMADGYRQGGMGFSEAERSAPEGVLWLRKSAALGYLPSMERLAEVTEKGLLGVAPDAAEAAALRTKIAEAKGTKDKPEEKRKRRRLVN